MQTMSRLYLSQTNDLDQHNSGNGKYTGPSLLHHQRTLVSHVHGSGLLQVLQLDPDSAEVKQDLSLGVFTLRYLLHHIFFFVANPSIALGHGSNLHDLVYHRSSYILSQQASGALVPEQV